MPQKKVYTSINLKKKQNNHWAVHVPLEIHHQHEAICLDCSPWWFQRCKATIDAEAPW